MFYPGCFFKITYTLPCLPPVIGVELNWGGGGKAGVTKRGRKGEQLISCPIQYDYEGERKAE